MPSRRQYLVTVGAELVGVAGSLSDVDGPTAPSPTSDPQTGSDTASSSSPPPSSSPSSPDTASPAVGDAVARKAITSESVMGSGGVLTDTDRHYVVASVGRPDTLEPSTFRFVAAQETWPTDLPDTVGALNHTIAGHKGGPLDRPFSDDEAYLAFTLPSPLSASNPRIRYADDTTDEWSLPPAARNVLAADAPRFELDSLSAPEALSQGETLSVTLTATNVSDVDGRLLVAIYWPTETIADDDESHLVDRRVATGETVTVTVNIDTDATAYEVGPVVLELRGHVEARRKIRLQDVSTPD